MYEKLLENKERWVLKKVKEKKRRNIPHLKIAPELKLEFWEDVAYITLGTTNIIWYVILDHVSSDFRKNLTNSLKKMRF